jgi:hypothetical protein
VEFFGDFTTKLLRPLLGALVPWCFPRLLKTEDEVARDLHCFHGAVMVLEGRL